MFGRKRSLAACCGEGRPGCEWVADLGRFERQAHLTMVGHVFDWRVRMPRGTLRCAVCGRIGRGRSGF